MEAFFTTWIVVMLRTSALIAVMPAFSMAGIPAKIRVALGALTALFVTGGQPAISLEGWSMVHLVMLMGSEILVGLLLGFVSKLFFYALDIAGSLIAMSLGIMMPTDINHTKPDNRLFPRPFSIRLAIMILFTTDMHHWFFAGIAKSYEVLPLGQALWRAFHRGSGQDDRKHFPDWDHDCRPHDDDIFYAPPAFFLPGQSGAPDECFF